MNKRTKATSIPKWVKDDVWERDHHSCIICGSTQAQPNAHFIKRSHGGLGVPQNIVTLCNRCHLQFDSSKDSMHIRAMIRDYLRNKYVGWQEHELRYVK